MQDLRDMKLKITDYRENSELYDAITRYYTLLQMSFETNIYKVIETPESQIYKSINSIYTSFICNEINGEKGTAENYNHLN